MSTQPCRRFHGGRAPDRLEAHISGPSRVRAAVEPPPPVAEGERVARRPVAARPPGLVGLELPVRDPAPLPTPARHASRPKRRCSSRFVSLTERPVLPELQHDVRRRSPSSPDFAEPEPQVQVLGGLEVRRRSRPALIPPRAASSPPGGRWRCGRRAAVFWISRRRRAAAGVVSSRPLASISSK